MKRIAGFIFSVCVLLSACGSGETDTGDKISAVSGKWSLVAFDVDVVSEQGDSSRNRSIQATESNMFEAAGYDHNSTIFLKTGQYEETYWIGEDSIMFQPSGNWKLTGDSITIVQTSPMPQQQVFFCKVSGDSMIFHGWVDFDFDGAKDDDYRGTYLRMKDF